jgi:DNA modification methylase
VSTETERPRAKLVRVQDLTPAEWNPRTIDRERFANLRKAISEEPEFLWLRPILATKDGTIYAGNMRYRAAAAEGLSAVPAIVEDITLEQAKRRAIRDNSSWGQWAEQELAEMLATLGGDRTTLGFDEGELERLLAVVGLAEERTDEEFDPTPPEIATTRARQVWALGAHRLACGDARDPLVWERLFAGLDPAGCMWTDPPYGVQPATALTLEGDVPFANNEPGDVAPLLADVFAVADHWLAPGASLYVCSSAGPMQAEFMAELARLWRHRQTLTWVKNTFGLTGNRYHGQHEDILYGEKAGAPSRWNDHRDESSVVDDEADLTTLDRPALLRLVKDLRNARGGDVIREDKTRHNDLHPTMKPPRLIRVTLGNSTVRGDVVVDPFAGSGSTMVACEQMGRRAMMIEIEPRFADVILRRYRELTGDEPALVDPAKEA